MTAAHCFNHKRYSSPEDKAKNLKIYAGDLKKKGEHAQILKAESVLLHPKFNYTYGDVNSKHDLAIVKLKQPIKISKRLRPICLGNIGFETNDIGVFQGYGYLADEARSKQLYEASVRIQSNESCKKVYGYMYTPDHLCAFNGTKAVSLLFNLFWFFKINFYIFCKFKGCSGDSGGPFFLTRRNRIFQIGISSFGGHCDGFPYSPPVFTRVSSYLQWIRDVTKVKDDCTPKEKVPF